MVNKVSGITGGPAKKYTVADVKAAARKMVREELSGLQGDKVLTLLEEQKGQSLADRITRMVLEEMKIA